MIKNYFKLAWRNILKHPFYSSVNIIGLFAGITFVLLIGAYIWSELRVNRQLRNADRQYFLQTEWKEADMGNNITTLGPLAKQLKVNYPNLVTNYYRTDLVTSVVSKGDKNFREGLQIGDTTLLNMFGFELLHGNKATALNDPSSVVITKDMAIKYFGKTDVVGETITIQNFSGGKKDFNITGVLKPIPVNSVTNLNEYNNNTFFIPVSSLPYFGRGDIENWYNTNIPSYIELKEGATMANLNKAIDQLLITNIDPEFRAVIKIRPVSLKDFYLQKDNDLVKRMLYALSFAGLFILLMAVVNFINIAISSAGNRMREIGVRKVMGGLRSQLIAQFLSESMILIFLSTMLALIAYPLAKPIFSNIVGKQLPGLAEFPAVFMLVPFVLILVVGLLAGSYPAFVLSAVNTVNSLKGKIKTVKENILLRKSLVGFQFATGLLVLCCAGIVTQQVNYFFSQRLGYAKEYVVSSQVPRNWTKEGVNKMLTVREEFEKIRGVSRISLSYEIPNGMNGGQPPIYKAGADSSTAITTQLLQTDENYLNTYKIALLAGEFFDSKRQDSAKVVLNEKAVKALGYKTISEAVGTRIKVPGDPTVFTIKGVVSNFHFGSMQKGLQPLMFMDVNTTVNFRFLSFKLSPGDLPGTLEAIRKKWVQLLPGSSFEYSFMDDALRKVYASEIQLKKASYAATVLSFIIVLLGVVGLTSLSIHKRIREIGIRKVLGATTNNILLLFAKEFALIIIVAACIACPVAYTVMNNWLNNYATHINISLQPFALSILALTLITLILIGVQTFKAAIANPVKSLRTE